MRFPAALPLALAFMLATPALAARPEAADNTLGMALLSAAIEADGTVLYGVGVRESYHTQTGQFDVEFVRDISGCAVVASVGLPYNAIAPVGFAQPRISNPTGIRVRTYDSNAANADRPFQVIVFCAK